MPSGLLQSSFARTARVCATLPLYRAFRSHGRPALLPLAMSFVCTDRCNSLCKTCNIGRRYIDDPSVADGELSLDEYTTLFRSIGRLEWVTFSGGEPFMRPAFPELVARAAELLGPRVINIPTNATLVRATEKGVRAILGRLGATELVVNVSLDGVGREHDQIRGFDGNFELALRTLAALRQIGDRRLSIGVNSVISRFNVDHAEELFRYVLDEIAPDSYVVELAQIRPEYHNRDDVIAAAPAQAAQAVQCFLRLSRERRRSGVPRLVKAFREKYYADVLGELREPRGHACYSGFGTCSVMAHGEVWSNTQRADVLGNVRSFGLDFRALWLSAQADRVRERVRSERCHCETSNVAYTNALMDFAELPKVLYHFVRGR